MIMDLLQKLGIKAGEDYIKGERESAPDFSNPEVLAQFLQDLTIGVSSGGIGASIKTVGDVYNLMKSTRNIPKLIKSKTNILKPVSTKTNIPKPVSKYSENIAIKDKVPFKTSSSIEVRKWEDILGEVKKGAPKSSLLDKIKNIEHPNAGLAYGGLALAFLYNKLRNVPFQFSSSVEPKAHDSIDDMINSTDPDSPEEIKQDILNSLLRLQLQKGIPDVPIEEVPSIIIPGEDNYPEYEEGWG